MTMMINSYGVNTGDPYWSQVTLLMGFDGSIVDEKGGLTVSFPTSGSPSIVTSPAQPYGSAWLSFLSAHQDTFEVTETADQFWLSGDFTVEVTAQLATFDAASSRVLFSQYNNLTSGRSWYVYADGIGGTNKVGLNISPDGINTTGIGTVTVDETGAALATGVTYRLCFERAGNTWRLYVNGKVITTATVSTAVKNSSEPLVIGGHNVSGIGQFLNGFLDEVRITNGRARYQGDYAPAVSKFPRH